MDRQQLEILLEKYITGDLTTAERQQLAEAAGQPGNDDALEVFVRATLVTDDTGTVSHPAVREAVLTGLAEKMGTPRIGQGRRPRVIRFVRLSAAAVIIVLFVGGAFLAWQARRTEATLVAEVPAVQDVAPGRNGAILTLADGKQVVLDSSRNGPLPKQGSTAVTEGNTGRLEYRAAATPATGFLFNTLTTPRGRSIDVLLSDGTRVWLNAASSIRYPVTFTGKDRTVQVSGEAYFQVAKDAAMPFRVEVSLPGGVRQEIQVLGTSFNVSAYGEDGVVRTTLVEGSVKVITGTETRPISPGQQLILDGSDQLQLDAAADVEKAVAWKEGSFVFHADDLGSIMRQLSRWYDIGVHFEGAVNDHYTGRISRGVNISQVLKMLEAAGGVAFSVQNKEVTVRPRTM